MIRSLLILLLATTAYSLPAAEWTQVWSDEFEVDGAPDPATWGYEVGRVRNKEAQYYTEDRRENARVEGGHLIIEARKEAYEGADYTAASLITRGKREWNRGRIAVRAKLPEGRGMWPAIWMLGTQRGKGLGWPECGEIDIMEFVGHNPGVIHGTVHCGAYNHSKGTHKGGKTRLEDPHGEFHVYAIEWFDDRIDFFVDDAKYFTFAKEPDATHDQWPYDDPHYLLLNIAVGGSWGGQKGIDDAILPQRLVVDWVRVFELAE